MTRFDIPETVKNFIEVAEGNEMTRFDIPETVKNFIEVAIETNTVDALSIYTLAIKYGDNWKALIDEIILYAYNNRHANKGAHKKVVKAAEEYWMTI